MPRAGIFMTALLTAALLAACNSENATLTATIPVEPGVTPTLIGPVDQPGMPTHVEKGEPADEAEIISVIAGFGKQLQAVSLQSPTAAQDIEKDYSAYVFPTLLQAWMSDPSVAPGRVVSSPWPDRIEITHLAREGPGLYSVDGIVVMISSLEAVGSGEATRIPVHITVEKTGGRWMITEYTEQH